MVRSVSVIFYTGTTYSCFSKNRYFVKLEEKTFPNNIEVIAKVLVISGFGIFEYYVGSEIGCMIVLRDQAYYVPGLPKYL